MEGYTPVPCQDFRKICEEVRSEIVRAVSLHGSMKSQHDAYAVILEELDEFWDLVKINPKKLNYDDAKKRLQNMRNELIQTSAMCIRAIHDLGLEDA